MAEQIQLINMRPLWRRLFLIVPVVLALGGMWFAARWYIGNTMASPEAAPDMQMAVAAVRLAPADPQTHYALAVLNRRTFSPEELPAAIREIEAATALSPNNYLLWMDLGRLRGQAGDAEGGLRALGRAVELAPNYAEPRWHLGNLLLRNNRIEEAFAELRRAGDAHPEKYRPQIFDLARRFYGDDTGQVIAVAGNSPSARADLIVYLLKQKRLDDALRVWAGLAAAEKKEQRAASEAVTGALFEAKRLRQLLEVQRDLATPEQAVNLVAERLLNSGFEDAIAPAGKNRFDWQVVPVAGAQIAIDPDIRHEGARSLRIALSAPSGVDFRNVSQLVVVEPRTRYRLTFYVRQENIQSVTTLATVVVDGASGSVLGASAPLVNGSSEWQPFAFDFTTGAQTESILLQISRPPCPDALCPIFGKVWYDDFALQRLDGNDSNARGRNVAAASGDDAAAARNAVR